MTGANVAWLVQVAADEQTLGMRRNKYLNAALLGAAAAHVAVLGPAYLNGDGGQLLPAILGCWSGAGVVALGGLLSKFKRL